MSSGWTRPCTRVYTSLPERYIMYFRPLPDRLASLAVYTLLWHVNTSVLIPRPLPTKVDRCRPGGTPVQTEWDNFTTAWSSLIGVLRSAVWTQHYTGALRSISPMIINLLEKLDPWSSFKECISYVLLVHFLYREELFITDPRLYININMYNVAH
jgi:hypothetical protein